MVLHVLKLYKIYSLFNYNHYFHLLERKIVLQFFSNDTKQNSELVPLAPKIMPSLFSVENSQCD